MPSSATITSFYSFVQNTKANASEVNSNFDNYRGHIIPINTDTVSASDLTHDLGSATHRWNKVYTQYLPINTGASIIFDASVQSEVLSSGCPPLHANRLTGPTVSAAIGGFAASVGTTNQSYAYDTFASQNISGMTLTIETTGRPVLLMIGSNNETQSGIYLQTNNSYTGSHIGYVNIFRNGTFVDAIYMTASRSVTYSSNITFPNGQTFIDHPTAGSNVYEMTARPASPGGNISMTRVKLKAFEL